MIFKLTKMYLLVIFYKLPYSVFLYLISVISVFSNLEERRVGGAQRVQGMPRSGKLRYNIRYDFVIK